MCILHIIWIWFKTSWVRRSNQENQKIIFHYTEYLTARPNSRIKSFRYTFIFDVVPFLITTTFYGVLANGQAIPRQEGKVSNFLKRGRGRGGGALQCYKILQPSRGSNACWNIPFLRRFKLFILCLWLCLVQPSKYKAEKIWPAKKGFV